MFLWGTHDLRDSSLESVPACDIFWLEECFLNSETDHWSYFVRFFDLRAYFNQSENSIQAPQELSLFFLAELQR